MKKSFLLLILFIYLAGCSNPTLSLPEMDQHKLLITHVKEPLLTVIDLKKQEVIQEDTLPFTVQSFAKMDQKLVMANKGAQEVLTLDLATGKIRPLTSAISSITDLWYDQEEKMLYMTDAGSDELLIFDPARGKITKRIKVGKYPQAISLHKPFLYILNGEETSVSVIELATHKVIHTFPVVEHPTDLIATDKHIWVGGHGPYGDLNQHVYVYAAPGGQLVEKIKAGSMPIALYRDKLGNQMLSVSHGSNELHVIDCDALQVKRSIATGENPYYVTGDKDHIYVTTLDGEQLMVFDRKTLAVKQVYALRAGPYGILLGGNWDE